MRAGQHLEDLTAGALLEFGRLLERRAPEAVLVQGDTTTAMACALAAYYRQIPVGHVEAGLRTGDRYRPFPEEINRRIITQIATWNFAPTERAAQVLRAEGMPAHSIFVTGNTVIDALLDTLRRAPAPEWSAPGPAAGRRLVLVTAHRRESFGLPFERLCGALAAIARDNPDVDVVYPVHLNPNVQAPVRRILGAAPRVSLIEPVGYPEFCRLMERATLILTDSGGIQEEAPSLGVPVLVLRSETERPEAVEAGVALLVGTEPSLIVAEANRLLRDESARRSMARSVSPFGDGNAAERIAAILLGS